MTPVEKANELLDKYWLMDFINPSLSKQQAKKCALIAVDEILNINSFEEHFTIHFYYLAVKKEIENL